jgi:septal ring factor EnvC (AmiA/AmiB activator)
MVIRNRPIRKPQIGPWLAIAAGVLAICGTIWASGVERGGLNASIIELRSAVVVLTSGVAANTAAINKLQIDQASTSTTLEERTQKLEVVTAQNHRAIRQQTDKSDHQTVRQEQLAAQQERDRISAANAAAISNRNAVAARAVAAKAADDANAAKAAAADSADSAADSAIAAATPAPVVVAPKAQRSLKSLLFGDPALKAK